MKLRLIVAICLLVLSVGSAVGFSVFLDKTAAALESALSSALESVLTEPTEWETATQAVSELWARNKSLYHIMLPHVNLNELAWALGTLPEYQRMDEAALYIESCVRGLQCIRTIRETEQPSLGNIF